MNLLRSAYIGVAFIVYAGVIDAATLEDGEPLFRQDYTYVASTKAFYKYHASVRSWDDAKSICESERTSLFYPENKDELVEAKQFAKKEIKLWFWIGLTMRTKSSETDRSPNALTIDGRSVNAVYNKWDDDEPNNVNGGEFCILIMDNDKLNDYHCNALMPFFCKLTLKSYNESPILQNYELNAPPQDVNYTSDDKVVDVPNYSDLRYLSSKRSFYRKHSEASWEDAKKKCISEGASLFYPEDLDEASKIVALTKDYHWRAWIWIGLKYSNEAGTYKNVKGRLASEGYVSWTPNEIQLNKCVLMQRDGTFRSRDCTKKYPYYCKKADSTII